MAKVTISSVIDAPVEQVWARIRDFNGLPGWHPRMGTFASRGTHRAGNAVIQAAKEARQVMLEVASEELEVNASDLETDGQGNILVKGAPQKSISIFDVALSAHFKRGRSISGRGMAFPFVSRCQTIESEAQQPPTIHSLDWRIRFF